MNNKRAKNLLKIIDRLTPIAILILISLLSIGYFGLDGLAKRILFGASNMVLTEEQKPIYITTLNLLQSIVSNIIPTGIVFLSSFLLLRGVQNIKADIQNEEIVNQIGFLVKSSYEIVQTTDEFGIISIHKRITEVGIGNFMANAKNVKILSIWSIEPSDYPAIFTQIATKTGYSIQVLLLNPDSESSKNRSMYFENNQEWEANMIKNTKNTLENLKSSHNINDLTVLYYESFLSFPIYIIDDIAFIGLFSHSKWSEHDPWISVRMKYPDGTYTRFGKFLNDEFEKVWTLAYSQKP